MLKVGCCGFCVAMKKYFSDFKLTEVQKTFYKPPKVEIVKKWREQAPADFEFTVKAWQVITHSPSSPTYRKAGIVAKNCGFFKPTKDVFDGWQKTREIAKILNSKIVLFQTPTSFKENEENEKNMIEFFSSIERDLTFVWEPRGWREEKVKEVCEKLDLIHCVDPFIAKPLYGEVIYLRLHGMHAKMYKHRYSDDELQWLRNICTSFEKNVYVLFNNVYMCEDALRFKNLNLTSP
jgi:uncharacterized protein YecE (DUF72 family)